MKLRFPDNFLWGTSTAAPQIETAFNHDFKGIHSKDNHILKRTIDHEKRRKEDAKIICSLGNTYRLSLAWDRLQKKPYGEFDKKVVKEYRDFLQTLKNSQMNILLTLHHFANPRWFASIGDWESENAAKIFEDYSKKVIENFGDLVSLWNTINEPNVYTYFSRIYGMFPPYKKNLIAARRTILNLAKAHELAYNVIKEKYPNSPVSISLNTAIFEGENFIGKILAKIADYFFLDYVADKFFCLSDFIGLSYYGKIPFTPFPVSEATNPGKLNKMNREHDKMWEYSPGGLKEILIRFSKKYHQPIIITENGCCTDNDKQRQKSIIDHLRYSHEAIQEGVDLKGYIQWSTFDNFEWFLGPTYRFGLYHVDYKTMKRTPKDSAKLFAKIAKSNSINI